MDRRRPAATQIVASMANNASQGMRSEVIVEADIKLTECQRSNEQGPAAEDDFEIRLWILRLLVPLGGYKQFAGEKDFNDDDLAGMLGLDDLLEPGNDMCFDRQLVIARLREAWKQAEEQTATCQDAGNRSDQAIRRLGSQIGLTETETEILRFRLMSERNRSLRNMLKMVGSKSLDSIVDILVCCLKRADRDIRHCLTPEGTLISSGIIEIRHANGWYFNDAVSLLGCITEEIHLAHDNPLAYFRSRIVRSAPPRLSEANYLHAGRDITVLRQFLATAVQRRSPGVNILIYGVPGSGKTEFARMLAAVLGLDLYEVATTRRDGTLLDGNDRFRAYRLGQALLGKSNLNILLFDEIEDMFRRDDQDPLIGSNRSGRKGAINKTLESNPIPAFWITNNIHVIDSAFLRRFDYVLELNAPPRSVRGRILDEYLADLPVSERWKKRMAEHEDLVPAVVERAAKVVGPLKECSSSHEVERALGRVMGNTLEAMGLPREPRNWAPLGEGYRLDVLNADCDMAGVQAGLARHRQGRLCLYGPPGTGKTAFGRHVTEVLDQPLMVRRASDIISPWVGMTERNLARMFRQAQEEEAVLLLDEADSFLRDRQDARQSWEITEVNEMLAQMECYEGIFIASTNLMDSLDAAALRRFDLKIRFDFLRPEQARILFIDIAERLGLDVPKAIEDRLARLDCLTPGDFANVERQTKLRCIASAHELLERLAAECEVKPEGKKRGIGFSAV